jgi:hypothetical protein
MSGRMTAVCAVRVASSMAAAAGCGGAPQAILPAVSALYTQ